MTVPDRATLESQLAGIIDSALDAVLTVDSDQNVALFNPAAEQMFGCAASEALGTSIRRFLPDWDALLRESAPSRRRHRACRSAMRRRSDCAARATVFRWRCRCRARNLTFWTCFARDITERQRAQEEHVRLIQERTARTEAERAEQRLRAYVIKLQEQAHLLEMAHVLVRDRDDRIIFWNKGTTQMYGWTEEEALGKQSQELLRTVFPVPIDEITAELHNRGQWEGELIHTCKDGRTIVVASHSAQHTDEHGAPVATLEVNNDVTELKQLQEALRQSDRRKDEFLAMLAHELRNPLAPILNALHIMRLGRNNAATIEESRTIIERQVRHMVRLIDDLLDLSRITRGKIQLRKEPVELAQVIQSAVESSRPAIDAAGHQLSVNLPKEPIIVEADPTRLAQVLLNLLNNAAKYTEAGGHIWISAKVQGDQLAISVRDSGIGIPSEMLPNIFEMFAQADRSLDRSQGGLGIGLSLVRGLVRLHGGTVTARSEGPGRGSEFVVRLPLAPVQSRSVVARSAEPARAAQHAEPRRILVVDDNVDGARTLENLLKMLGHEVAVTHDGYAALDEAPVPTQHRPSGHRPARHERLRGRAQSTQDAGDARRAAGRDDRLGQGGRPPQIDAGRFQRASR